MNKKKFSHIKNKKLNMVDVSQKNSSKREASASAMIRFQEKVYYIIKERGSPKGEIFSTAKIAGIQAAKKTYQLIPLCHNIKIDHISLNFEFKDEESSILINSHIRCDDKTGVEIEALNSVLIAALTIYDMCKSLDKGIEINHVKLLKKKGGKSGEFTNDSS